MKKLITALSVVVLVLAVAGISSATDVNIYGASAQYNFWSNVVTSYMTSLGCVAPSTISMDTTAANCNSTTAFCDGVPSNVYYHGAKYFIATSASGCNTTYVPDGTLTIRVTAYDSWDGINSVSGGTNPVDVMGCTGNTRAMLNSATFVAASATPAYQNLACLPVHLGAADVDGETLIQATEGSLDGGSKTSNITPYEPSPTYGYKVTSTGTGAEIPVDLGDFSASSSTTDPSDGNGTNSSTATSYVITPTTTCPSSTLKDNHPFVVPFAFFANANLFNVLAGTCTNGTPTGCTDSVSSGASLTQTMVEQIFTGAVTDWHTFFPTQMPSGSTIVKCMRVAGSGTYATFDAGVMKTNKAGGSALPQLDTVQNAAVNGSENYVWFNNTTGDMMKCIDNYPGAIGFADASQANTAVGSGLNGTIGPLQFNGNLPSAANIQNGVYDRFWSLEHIFQPTNTTGYSPAYPTAAVTHMIGYTQPSTGSNIPSKYAPYWSQSSAMQVHKTNDFAFPPVLGAYNTSTSSCY